ncbi:MAG: nicotinamide-nucleotide amidohydrolase family protein [Planctomycetota bacterium]
MTAPGLYARDDASACDLFCLPGPPREMRPMFEREIAARLAGHAGTVTRARYLLTIGLGESAVAEQLGTLMDRGREDAGEVLVGTTASRGVVTCRLRATAADNNTAAGMLDEVEAQIRERLPAVIFDRRDPDPSAGSDHDLSDALPRAVLEVLRARHEKIAVVESCTGGGLGAELTSVPGSSDVFFGGWITYENAAKVEMVGVPPDAFSAVGAVSRECAQAMAAGGLDRAREMDRAVAHAIAITGIAGPAGGGDDKPAGTVWIARASADGTGEARRFLFRGGRAAVREWSSRAALAILRLHLIGESMTLLAETHD